MRERASGVIGTDRVKPRCPYCGAEGYAEPSRVHGQNIRYTFTCGTFAQVSAWHAEITMKAACYDGAIALMQKRNKPTFRNPQGRRLADLLNERIAAKKPKQGALFS
jgi:hypothetical protein